MAERTGSSNAFWWGLIGFFLGVAATLAAVIFVSRGERAPEDADPPPQSVATVAPPRHHRAPNPPASSPTAAVGPVPATAADAPISDEQVAEDAAAAGMTSRARTPQ